MARASAIWIAFGPNKVPLACFTVKHECASFLVKTDLNVHTVARFQDGVYDPNTVHWDLADFLAAAGR